jgi:hypothetical protein
VDFFVVDVSEKDYIIVNMRDILYDKHQDCEVVVNWARTNAQGLPALCCKQHRDKHNRLCYIDWVSKKELSYLIYVLEIEEIYEEPYGNYNTYFG